MQILQYNWQNISVFLIIFFFIFYKHSQIKSVSTIIEKLIFKFSDICTNTNQNRFGMVNSINTLLRLNILHTPHKLLTFNKNKLNWV